jgi:hypothetical protein
MGNASERTGSSPPHSVGMMGCQRFPSSPCDRSIDATVATPIAQPASSRHDRHLPHQTIARRRRRVRCASSRTFAARHDEPSGVVTFTQFRRVLRLFASTGDEIVASRAGRGSDLALLFRRSRYRSAEPTRPSQRLAVHRHPRTQGVGSVLRRRSHPRPVPALGPYLGRERVISVKAAMSVPSIVRTRPIAAETHANYFAVWVSGAASPAGAAVGVGVLK